MRDRRVNWRDDDQGFRAWAKLGHDWQRPVLKALQAAGLPAVMPALEVREHVSQAYAYRNQADIWVGEKRIEVKSVAFAFTNSRDWPYPTVRLDPRAKYHAKTPRPTAYVFISRQTGAMVAVRGDDESRTERAWSVRDRERGTKDDWVTMPREALIGMRGLINYLNGSVPCLP